MTEEEKKAKIFEGKRIRTHWDEEKEKWFFSIVDVIEILTESQRPRKYWTDLKETDVGDTEQILREGE